MIKFLAKNLINKAKLTPSTVNAQYPVSNVNDSRRTKVYRSTSNSDNIVIDLGVASNVDSFAIVDNWADGFGITSLTLEANGADTWTSPAFTTSITLDDKFGLGVKEFNEQEYRFWRVVVTSTLGFCELSNMFLGLKTDTETNGISYDWTYKNNDLVVASSNRYGQVFFDDAGTRKQLSGFTFEVMNTTEIEKIFQIYDICRTVQPLFIRFGDGLNEVINEENRLNGFYRLTSEPIISNISSGFYNVTLDLTELK